MSCPYFYPTELRAGSGIFPLGDSWTGECRVDHGRADGLCCNFGYAREECSRFPRNDGPDAVRFTIAGEDANGVRLYYVMERDHHPYTHGMVPDNADPVLARQAAAYAESYRRRKGGR